ncbi:MAG: hypothetical protein COA84_02910 [Robiginitomaculum sp.]|nr:MAG: hypothetical protein COA84_02910 [Robiginitomaculum sp.]
MSALLSLFKDKLTTNAAYGLVVLGTLLGMLFLSNLYEFVVQVQTNALYAERELAKLNTIKKSDVWSQRVEESENAKKAWENTKLQGETVGVLAAKIQQKLITLSEGVSMMNPQIRVNNELIEVDGQTIMRFSLSGTLPRHFPPIDLLLALAEEDKRIIVDEVVTDFYKGNRSLIRLSGMAIVHIIDDSNQAGSK